MREGAHTESLKKKISIWCRRTEIAGGIPDDLLDTFRLLKKRRLASTLSKKSIICCCRTCDPAIAVVEGYEEVNR